MAMAISPGRITVMDISPGRTTVTAISTGRITVMAISPGRVMIMVISTGRIMAMATIKGRIKIMAITPGRIPPRAAMEKSSFSNPRPGTRRRPYITRRRRAITRQCLTSAMAITGGPAFRSILGSEAPIVRVCRAGQFGALCAR
jgi:hypothetical protein